MKNNSSFYLGFLGGLTVCGLVAAAFLFGQSIAKREQASQQVPPQPQQEEQPEQVAEEVVIAAECLEGQLSFAADLGEQSENDGANDVLVFCADALLGDFIFSPTDIHESVRQGNRWHGVFSQDESLMMTIETVDFMKTGDSDVPNTPWREILTAPSAEAVKAAFAGDIVPIDHVELQDSFVKVTTAPYEFERGLQEPASTRYYLTAEFKNKYRVFISTKADGQEESLAEEIISTIEVR